jgi:hypothetical protein
LSHISSFRIRAQLAVNIGAAYMTARALSVAIMLGLIRIDDTLCGPNTWLYEFNADVFWLGSGSAFETRAMSDASSARTINVIRLIDKVPRLVSFP